MCLSNLKNQSVSAKIINQKIIEKLQPRPLHISSL